MAEEYFSISRWTCCSAGVAEMIRRAEVRQAVRSTGAGDLSDIATVVLETSGKLS